VHLLKKKNKKTENKTFWVCGVSLVPRFAFLWLIVFFPCRFRDNGLEGQKPETTNSASCSGSKKPPKRKREKVKGDIEKLPNLK
jgi:hypothetical protein